MPEGTLLSKRDVGRIERMLRWFERSGWRGQQFRRRKNPDDRPLNATADLWLFEVQSATAADGIYNCLRQTTFGSFSTPVTEVLNLLENNTLANYTPALAAGDIIAAWRMADENGTMRWVGFPLVPSVRMARTTETAGEEQQITCNLIANDGKTEITSGLGSAIEFYGKICGGENLNSASPDFSDNEYLFGVPISGKWHIVTVFMSSEPRVCK